MARTEREKMLAGELYIGNDPELVAMRRSARGLLVEYNATTPEQSAARAEILRALLGSCGKDAWIEPPFYCDYGVNIFMGKNVYLNFNCIFLDCAEIHVGDNVKFGPLVQLYTAHHPLDATARSAGPELASPIRIGADCWLGGGAIVCPGVTIGAGTTIGAGSVVTRDIPPGVLAVGNPCRVVRKLDQPA